MKKILTYDRDILDCCSKAWSLFVILRSHFKSGHYISRNKPTLKYVEWSCDITHMPFLPSLASWLRLITLRVPLANEK